MLILRDFCYILHRYVTILRVLYICTKGEWYMCIVLYVASDFHDCAVVLVVLYYYM